MHLYSKWPKELSARISSSFLLSTGNLNQHNPPPRMKFSPLNCSSRPPPHVGCNQLTLVSCFLPSHRRTKLAKLTQINRWANLASHGRSERVKYEAGLVFSDSHPFFHSISLADFSVDSYCTIFLLFLIYTELIREILGDFLADSS